MRLIPCFLLFSISASVACTSASGGGDALSAPEAPISEPAAPSLPDQPPAGEPSTSARTAEEVCPGADDIGEPTGRACTEMGCVDGFHLLMTPTSSWPHGDYRYIVEVDGLTVTCEGSLPLRACGSRTITCSDPAFDVTESGCAIDPSLHAFGAVQIPGFPARVHLRVELNGKAVADEELDLVYKRNQPNGPGCGPVCCGAADEVTLTF